MFVCNPDALIIHGTTSNGKVFRPSDWAERLCGILSSFDKGHRLSYHEWVRPILIDKVRSVAIDPKLESINPNMFRFLMDFAADNDLRVVKGEELINESNAHQVEKVAPAAAPVAENLPEKAEAEEAFAEYTLREIAPDETACAFAALSVLRPLLTDINAFVAQVNDVQRAQGYRLFGIFEDNKNHAVAVCGFREETNLVSGRHIHIDDLVTVPQSRKRGYAARLLSEIQKIAAEQGINYVEIDSSVGGERTTAHRVYFQHGFEINAYHFVYNAAAEAAQ